MDLTFLGTASGSPTRERNLSAGALRFDDGRVWLVDCGEATQHQLLRTDIRPGRIAAVLLTHLHGDHCFGLPGLLASLSVHDRSEPVTVVGPRGVAEWLTVTLRIAGQRPGYRLAVVELDPAGGDLDLPGDWRVDHRPLVHRVESHAFRLREAPRRGHLDPARAAALGVESGPQLGRLARGECVVTTAGTTVEPDQVLGPPRPGRQVVWCGDSADSRCLIDWAEDSDLLVHECTFAADRAESAAQWGHSTSAQIGALAARLRPRHLALTHISSRYGSASDPEVGVARLQREAAAECPGLPITMAEDFLRIPIPRREPEGA